MFPNPATDAESLILRNAANGGVSRRMIHYAVEHLSFASWSALRGRFAAPQGEGLRRSRAADVFHVKQAVADNEV